MGHVRCYYDNDSLRLPFLIPNSNLGVFLVSFVHLSLSFPFSSRLRWKLFFLLKYFGIITAVGFFVILELIVVFKKIALKTNIE